VAKVHTGVKEIFVFDLCHFFKEQILLKSERYAALRVGIF
jgi:hypothetical protein